MIEPKRKSKYAKDKPPRIKGVKRQLKDRKGKIRWVDRANADDKKSIPVKGKDGEEGNATHLMGMSRIGPKEKSRKSRYLVYPTVKEDENGELQQLEEDEALEATRKPGEALIFKSEKKALKASAYGYKKHNNFPKEVVKEAKKDWKAEKKGIRLKKRST